MAILDVFSKKIVTGLGVITVLFSIVGGIWGFELHYATNERVDEVKMTASDDIKELEIQVAGALENQQNKSNVRYLQFLYDKLTNDIFEIKKQLIRYPDDPILKEDYKDLLQRRKEVKNKLDDAMSSIKVN